MIHPALKHAAALHALHQASTNELIAAAHSALDDGLYTYSLGELASTPRLTLHDAGKWFSAAIGELGYPLPSPSDAITTILLFELAPLVESHSSPRARVNRILQLFESWLLAAGQSTSELSVPDPISRLADCQADYELAEYFQESEGRRPSDHDYAQVDETVHEIARQWLLDYYRKSTIADCRTSTVFSLAHAIQIGKGFDRLPILADALEEAGCDEPDVLLHLRGNGPHARGCWVVDAILS